ncbi:MAG: hypothetical protein AB7P37_19175 [Ramlibacter sp.]
MKKTEHTPQQPTTAASRPIRWKRWLLAALALPVIYVAGALAYELNREHFRLDLPAFDHAKARNLTPEKRAAYEQELFSELQLWNRGSRKYPTLEDIERREQRWQQMADDGFELAHITLRVLKPKGGLVHSLAGPMKRLEELAEQGDTGAMCLMPGLVNVTAEQIDWKKYRSASDRWLQRGAELRHPQCMRALGGRMIQGVPGYPHDVKRGLELEFAARRAGYAHDVGALVLYYESKGYADAGNVRRLYCWLQIESQSWLTRAPDLLLERLQRDASMQAIFDELKDKKFSLQNCIDLGPGE